MLHVLNDALYFPPVESALDDGLLAVGGDLRPERLLLAYSKGIFPWYNEDEPPLWWCPDPRFVLFPDELKISKSMKQVMKKGVFELRINTAFEAVMRACMTTARPGQDGTWISEDIVAAYTRLHELGYAYSAEAWHGEVLAGGLYGVKLGNVFFGESMFAHKSNASKFAFINWVQHLQQNGTCLIDCQVFTEHLESLGAKMIARKAFTELLEQLL